MTECMNAVGNCVYVLLGPPGVNMWMKWHGTAGFQQVTHPPTHLCTDMKLDVYDEDEKGGTLKRKGEKGQYIVVEHALSYHEQYPNKAHSW